MRLSSPEAAKVGHSLRAFLKPWICWAWGSLGARPLVWISVSTFLVPSSSRIAWPSAPERLRGFRWALKCSPCSLWPSRSPPLANATETRLSDMTTASSSASPSFFDKVFSYFFVRSSILLSVLLLPTRLSCSLLLQTVPFYLRSCWPKRPDPHPYPRHSTP